MGAPAPELNNEMPSDEPSAENFVASLRTISPPERRKHASVFNYWQSIRRDRQFPPIRDLDPLEISDAGPFSLLLEMIGGGEDAEIRHIGHAIKGGVQVERIGDAPNPSLLSCIASRLPVVAACRDGFAFEDEFETADGKTRCWVTLLPFSASGTWIDYVYGFVTLDGASVASEAAPETDEEPEQASGQEAFDEDAEAPADEPEESLVEPLTDEDEPSTEIFEPAGLELPADSTEPAEQYDDANKPSLSEKLLGKLSNIGGFYGRPVEIELDPDTVRLETWEADEFAAAEEPTAVEEAALAEEAVAAEDQDLDEELDAVPTADEFAADEQQSSEASMPTDEPAESEEFSSLDEPSPSNEPTPMSEGTLHSKLTEVREKADEARQAKLRANVALYEGLSAAYDFALDAEEAPEEYLKLVEAQGLKIQLRSPMKPVVKLAFNGMCDDATITQLEAVLAWALQEELPRGSLAERIESEGGIGPILNGLAEAA